MAVHFRGLEFGRFNQQDGRGDAALAELIDNVDAIAVGQPPVNKDDVGSIRSHCVSNWSLESVDKLTR